MADIPSIVKDMSVTTMHDGVSTSAIRSKIIELLEELQELGLSVKKGMLGDRAYVDIGRVVEEGCMSECTIYPPLSESTVVNLVARRDQEIFHQGVAKLKFRILSLGWSITEYSSCEVREMSATLQMKDDRKEWKDLGPAALRELEDLVETAEVSCELEDHMEEFKRADILVKPYSTTFTFILRESDPAITRRLTMDNVKELIAIARAMNDVRASNSPN